jgi:hypothetical protein
MSLAEPPASDEQFVDRSMLRPQTPRFSLDDPDGARLLEARAQPGVHVVDPRQPRRSPQRLLGCRRPDPRH